MGSGKTKTYIKYAFGEVFLVVIGILIALWLNNWNEAGKDRIREAFFLGQIKQELLAQKAEIEKRKDFSKGQVNNIDSVAKKFNELNYIGSSEFNQQLSSLISAPNFIVTNTVFTEIKSTGQLELIKSDSLRTQLMRTYEELDKALLGIMNNDENVYYPHVFTPLLKFLDKDYPSNLKKEYKRTFSNEAQLLQLWDVIVLARLCFLAYDNALHDGTLEIDRALTMLTNEGVE